MTDEKIEEKISELEENLDDRNQKSAGRLSKLRKILSKLNQRILDSNGFLTKEGGYLSKSEWHAVAIPAGWISAAYMLPQPLDVLTFVSYLLMNKKGFDLLQSDYEGHWNDVMEEYAYAAVSFGLTVAFWTFYVEEELSGAGGLDNIIGRILLGA